MMSGPGWKHNGQLEEQCGLLSPRATICGVTGGKTPPHIKYNAHSYFRFLERKYSRRREPVERSASIQREEETIPNNARIHYYCGGLAQPRGQDSMSRLSFLT